MKIVEDEDAYIASIPDLPGCVSYGDTLDEAVKNLAATKDLWIKGQLDSGQAVPEPTQLADYSGKVVLRIPRGLHKSLDREARQQGVSFNQYVAHVLSERHTHNAVKDSEHFAEQVAQAFRRPARRRGRLTPA
jgi:predicted RNase H-like HicB family nuclease